MSGGNDIVIVGAGQAGFQAAASLRETGFGGTLTVVGDEAVAPYQRPPLSKAYLTGKATGETLALRAPGYYADHRIALRLGTRAVALDGPSGRSRSHRASDCPTTISSWRRGPATAPCRCRGPILPVSSSSAPWRCRRHPAPPGRRRARRHRGRGLHRPRIRGRRRGAGDRRHGRRGRRTGDVPGGLRAVSAFSGPRTRPPGSGSPSAPASGASRGRTGGSPRSRPPTVVSSRPIWSSSASASCRTSTSRSRRACRRRRHPRRPRPPHVRPIHLGDRRLRRVPERLRGGRADADRVGAERRRPGPLRRGPAHRPAAPYAALPWFWSDQGRWKLQIAGLARPHDRTVTRGDPANGPFSVFCYREGHLVGVEIVNRPADHMIAGGCSPRAPRWRRPGGRPLLRLAGGDRDRRGRVRRSASARDRSPLDRSPAITPGACARRSRRRDGRQVRVQAVEKVDQGVALLGRQAGREAPLPIQRHDDDLVVQRLAPRREAGEAPARVVRILVRRTRSRFSIAARVRLTGPLSKPITWQMRVAGMPGSMASRDMIRHSVTFTPKRR